VEKNLVIDRVKCFRKVEVDNVSLNVFVKGLPDGV
jgi:hypothetical protein